MNPSSSRTVLHVTGARDDAVRADQARFGQRQGTAPKKFVAKGHDSQLQDAQFSKAEVVVELVGETGKDALVGIITRRDKWTVTVLEHDCKFPVIIYKHAIKTIVIREPIPAPTEIN